MSKCSMNDAQSHYLIPGEGPADSLRNLQPDFPKWAESDINLPVCSATTPLQATDASEQPGTSTNSRGAERGVKVQPPENTRTQQPRTDGTQTQQSAPKMQPASTAMPRPQTALSTAMPEKAVAQHRRSQETPLPGTLKSLTLTRLEQDSKTAGKSIRVTGRTRQSDPTRIKTDHRIHPNPKASTQRKAAGAGNSNATGLKESKASSKSRASQKSSPGLHAGPSRSTSADESLSPGLKVAKNSFTSKRGLVLSKSALADLSSPLTLSPRVSSPKTSPRSAPARSPDSLGPNKEVLRSSASVPGSGRVATSSLKTKTTFGLTMGGGSAPEAPTAAPEEVKTCLATSGLLSRGLTFDASTESPVQTETLLFQDDERRPSDTHVSPGKEENKKPEIRRHKEGTGKSSLSPLTASSTHLGRSRTVRDSASMTDIRGRFHQQRDVGTQVDLNSCSALQELPASSSLVGSPERHSGIETSVSKPSFHHVCRLDIELRSRTVLSSGASGDASSRPTCLRTASFQQKSDHSLTIQTMEEAEKNGGGPTQQYAGIRDTPQEVVWDKQGMTWEVSGASVDLDCLGVAIQSHLESKIKEQQNHISSLRRSICSTSNTKGCKVKMKRRGGVFTCCRKASVVKD